jgi:dihydrofolate reductase
VAADPGDANLDKLRPMTSQSGKDIAVPGSSELTATLLDAGLVDELRLMVNPVLLGPGHAVTAALPGRIRLRIKSAAAFSSSGNVLLCYEPVR